MWAKVAAIYCLLLFACGDAPRNNPLDPENPRYTPQPAVPKIDSLFFYSVVGLRGRNDMNLYLVVYIDDARNPVEYLSVTNTLKADTIRLNYIAEQDKYEYIFDKNKLGVNIPDQVIGQTFYLYATDRTNNLLLLEQLEIRRIIKEEVRMIAPGANETVAAQPKLTWESDFDDQDPVSKNELDKIYHFNVEILNENLENVWFKEHLSIKQKEIEVDQALTAGEYRWGVSIVDIYRNRLRTQLRRFTVE
jgi:hypothetical protein